MTPKRSAAYRLTHSLEQSSLGLEPGASPDRSGLSKRDPWCGVVMFDGDLRVRYINEEARGLMRQESRLDQEFRISATLSIHMLQLVEKVRHHWLTGNCCDPWNEVCVHDSLQGQNGPFRILVKGLPHLSGDLSKYAILVLVLPHAPPGSGVSSAMC